MLCEKFTNRMLADIHRLSSRKTTCAPFFLTFHLYVTVVLKRFLSFWISLFNYSYFYHPLYSWLLRLVCFKSENKRKHWFQVGCANIYSIPFRVYHPHYLILFKTYLFCTIAAMSSRVGGWLVPVWLLLVRAHITLLCVDSHLHVLCTQ